MSHSSLPRSALLVLLFALSHTASAKTRDAAAASAVVLVMPFATGEDVPEWGGYALQELITDQYAQAGVGNFVSTKQLDSALRRKDLMIYDATDLEVALPLARALGVTGLVMGELKREAGKLTVAAQLYDVAAGGVTRRATVSGPDDGLVSLADDVAAQLLDARSAAGPITRSPKALEQASLCWVDLIRYPLQPRLGNVPPLDRADSIEARCSAALEADPQLGWARAGVAILQSLAGKKAEARQNARESQKGRFNAFGYVAESFVARREGDLAGARAALEAGYKERAGFLLALSFLAEDRMEADDFAGAVAAWDKYLKRAPHHPFALGQKAKALGYLREHAEALRLTRQALKYDPDDPDLLIELASRQIDAGQEKEAEETLRRVMEARPPRPLAWLRLGFLYLKQKRLQDAHDVLIEAVTFAYREDEARTRGIAFADLAQASALGGNLSDALQYLSAAKAEGNRRLPCEGHEFDGLRGKPEFDSLCAAH